MLVAMSRRGSRHTNTRLGIKVAIWTAATTSALPRLPSGDGVTDRMYGCRALRGWQNKRVEMAPTSPNVVLSRGMTMVS